MIAAEFGGEFIALANDLANFLGLAEPEAGSGNGEECGSGAATVHIFEVFGEGPAGVGAAKPTELIGASAAATGALTATSAALAVGSLEFEVAGRGEVVVDVDAAGVGCGLRGEAAHALERSKSGSRGCGEEISS